MLNLDAIRCFCLVVDTGSFGRAAERLHRTQPAVSQRIHALEKELGDRLLDRKTGKPTHTGRIVYDRGVALLRAAGDLETEVRETISAGVTELRIGTSDTNALYYLPRKVRAFSRTMPQVRVFIHCRSSDQVAEEVERGELDLGIVTLPLARPGLETRKLFEQRLVLVARTDHRLAARQQTRLSQLAGEPMILIHESTRTGSQLQDHFRDEDFEPNVVMDSGSFEVIKQYVAEGVGVSILPEAALRPDDRTRLARVRIPGLPKVAIGAVWRENVYHTEPAQAFRDLLFKNP